MEWIVVAATRLVPRNARIELERLTRRRFVSAPETVSLRAN